MLFLFMRNFVEDMRGEGSLIVGGGEGGFDA
jgi:hypothetical protein